MNVFISILIGILCVNVWVTFSPKLGFRLFPALGFQDYQTRPALSLAIILLLIFNFNLLYGIQCLFAIFTFATFLMVLATGLYVPRDEIKRAMIETVAILIVELFALAVVAYVFKAGRYWLNEGANHDSLVYFEGMHWVMDSPLWVHSEEVAKRWGFGKCGEGGSMWIGNDCSLYRGGAYSLAAWLQFFSPAKTGVGLFGLFAYAGLFLWVAINTLFEYGKQQTKQIALTKVLITLLLLFSTAIVGALINSNLATMLASACIAIVVAICAAREIPLQARCILAALWMAVGTHIYAESLFYSGLIVFIAFVIEVIQEWHHLTFKKILLSTFAFVITLLVCANVTILASFNSLFTFNAISQGGDWTAWYIDAPVWAWLGSFVAGELMGGKLSSLVIAGVGAVTSVLALLILWSDRRCRPAIVAVVVTSILVVWLIEARSYRYGEHKILQLLGTTWCLLLVFAALQTRKPVAVNSLYSGIKFSSAYNSIGIAILICLIGIESEFLVRGAQLMRSWEPAHAINNGFRELLSDIKAGDVVLIDDSSWVGVEKFHKTHYLAFIIAERGAHAVMTDFGNAPLRGGYYRNFLNNTLSKSTKPDWYLTAIAKPGVEATFISANVIPTETTKDFVLYKVNHESSGLIVPSDGWYDCEPSHCWTSGAYTMEVITPDNGLMNELQINSDFYFPPENGQITIEVNGQLVKKIPPNSGVLALPLSTGHNLIRVIPSWETRSPLQLGLSADPRKLFASVNSVKLLSNQN